MEDIKVKKKKSTGFQGMNLYSPILKAIIERGYRIPTPIQRKLIPVILEGKNVIAMSRTGSGKSAAFIIPLCHLLSHHSLLIGCRALILSPTRELTLQTAKFFKEFSRHTDLRIAILVGGLSIENQFAYLAQNPDVIIATPGRLIHHINEIGLQLDKVKYIIYDEADRLFEMGLGTQLNQICDALPVEKQTIVVSATIPEELSLFASSKICNYSIIKLDKESQLSDDLELIMLITNVHDKAAALLFLLKEIVKKEESTMIFVTTKYHVNYFQELLRQLKIDSVGIYGDMDKIARNESFYKFKSHQINLIVVTDVAARGLDIPFLSNVIHYDFPTNSKLFIHRSGRTARAGQKGRCICLVTNLELSYMLDLGLYISRKMTTEKIEGENLKEFATYGSIPVNYLSDYFNEITEIHKRNSEMDKMVKSIQNSQIKISKMKVPASNSSVIRSKEILKEGIPIHFLFSSIIPQQEDLNNFLSKIKHYKPQHIHIMPNSQADSKRILTSFANKNKLIQNDTKDDNYKITNEIIQDEDVKEEIKKDFEEELNDNKIHIKNDSLKSKKNKINENIKINSKRMKRSQMTDFKDSKFYISDKPLSNEKLNDLWGKDAPSIKNDIFSLFPDDSNNSKIEMKSRWNKKNKKYSLVAVDKSGKVVPDKTLKSIKGDISSLKRGSKFFSKWSRNYKIKMQKIGETEDPKNIETTKSFIRHIKSTSSKKSEFGSELKTSDQILKNKKKMNQRKSIKKTIRKKNKRMH